MKALVSSVLVLISLGLLSGCAELSFTNTSKSFEPSKDFLVGADSFSPEEEDVLGQAVAARVLAGAKPIANKEIQTYVNQVGKIVVAASPRPDTFAGYSFIVLDSDAVNAMSAPGGYVFISEGLFRLLKNEDELAAVLAHEISHVAKKHGLLAIKKENNPNYLEIGNTLVSALDCSGLLSQTSILFEKAVDDIYDKLAVSGYSQDQEYEADKEAVSILVKAGYDTKAFDEVLKKLGFISGEGGWFKTHPSPQKRREVLAGLHPMQITSSEKGFVIREKRFGKVAF